MATIGGQWIGTYSGTNNGSIVVDIDEMRDRYVGVARLADANSGLPPSIAFFETSSKRLPTKFSANIRPLDPRTGQASTAELLKETFPDVIFPTSAEVRFSLTADRLNIDWKTEIGTHSSATLPRSQAAKPSKYPKLEMSWDDFHRYVSTLEFRRFIFRGQNRPWRLRTNFHRTGRANLNRFLAEDIQALHNNLSARTRHIFDLDRPKENGAFFNLVQHHGYPTPLLDWTYSPYVAVYFAYRGALNIPGADLGKRARVRLFMFDKEEWSKDFLQLQNLTPVGRHFSIMEFIAINNERMIPQQALSSVTNVDDIEGYIQEKEEETGKSYLSIIDLPVSDRKTVMRELSTMGITAGSLFPGLDGACAEIRERFFDL